MERLCDGLQHVAEEHSRALRGRVIYVGADTGSSSPGTPGCSRPIKQAAVRIANLLAIADRATRT
jgi:hypothetical protein